MKTLKIGIVGGGGMGRVHYANWKAVEGAEVVALCGNAAAAEEWGVPSYKTIADMVRDTEIDVVDICTPTFLHHDQVIEALQLGKDEIAIFEGIHALNDIITGKNQSAMKVYISARSNILDENGQVVFKGTWMRLARRTVRDAKFRAWEPDVTIKMWPNVRRGEKLYISPFKDNANIQFDSSLPYEVSVVKSYAQPLFEKLHLSPNMERYEEIGHLVEAYPKLETLDEKYVAADSLIREFIGGGIYDD